MMIAPTMRNRFWALAVATLLVVSCGDDSADPTGGTAGLDDAGETVGPDNAIDASGGSSGASGNGDGDAPNGDGDGPDGSMEDDGSAPVCTSDCQDASASDVDDASTDTSDASSDDDAGIPNPCSGGACDDDAGDAGNVSDAGDAAVSDAGGDDASVGLQLESFEPSLGFLNLADSNQPTFPDALTVTLNAPAPADTFISVLSVDENIVTVTGGGVTVPTGQTSASVLLTALAYGTISLTATLGTSLMADVTVLDPVQQPVLTDLTPATETILPGGSVQFTVALDIPAPVGGTTINLAANPSNGTLPSSVQVPAGQLSATFTYTDNGGGSNVTVEATLGATTLQVNLTGGTAFFSEYVEGSSNNKAVEIGNPFSTSLNLTGCVINVYLNGSLTPSVPAINLTATVAAGDVYVVCNPSASPTVLALCDKQDSGINFSGDDAVELKCNAIALDVIGQIGTDPGSQWGTAPTSTFNNTLRRHCGTSPDPNGGNAFNPSPDWAGFSQDTFSGLGDPACAP